MIYLYALTEQAPHGFGNLGLEQEPVMSMSAGDFQVVHSRHAPHFEPPVTPEALWTHEAILDELLEAGPVLPFRFGTTLPHRGAALAVIARDAARFRRTFADVRDRVELAVRVALPDAAASTPRDGTGYLAARLADRAAQRRVADNVLAPLDGLAAASRRREADRSRVIRASYLVGRGDVGRFTSAVEGLQAEHPELALSCTGPWAPYSFVEEAR